MTLDEIVTEVIAITGRPDRADYIRRNVRAAITEIHGTGLFPRDRVEEVFKLNEPTSLIKLTLPPRFKRFEVLGAVTDQGLPIILPTKNGQYDRVDPAGLFSPQLQTKTNIYYVAGVVLNIRSSLKVPNIFAMYYRFPEVADNNLETWIMAAQSSLVLDYALSKVYGTFGRQKEGIASGTNFRIAMQEFVYLHITEGND